MTVHLGSQISALADGQLAPAAAERALSHVAGCPECATELQHARAARRALAAAMDVVPDPQLTARLLALRDGACGPSRPRAGSHETRPAGFTGSAPLPGAPGSARLPDGCLNGDLRGRRRVAPGVLALSGVGLGAAVAVLLVLGEQPSVTPSAHTAYALTVLGRAPTSPVLDDGAPTPDRAGTDAAVVTWMADQGWEHPEDLPDGYRVTGVRADVEGPGSVEIDLAGPNGPIVLTQRPGRLNADAVEDLPVQEVGPHTVHVLSTAPWHGVWQQGPAVVDVLATAAADAPTLVAAYPQHTHDDGVGARISRGWTALAGAWSP